MNEVLDRAQIFAKYPAEWVLLGDPQTDEHLAVKGGTVLYHSKDPEEFDRKLLGFRPERCAIIYTGEMPECIAINL